MFNKYTRGKIAQYSIETSAFIRRLYNLINIQINESFANQEKLLVRKYQFDWKFKFSAVTIKIHFVFFF